MRGNVIETIMGAVVLVVAALFLVFAYNTSQVRSVSGYEVSADFERVDGIHDGSDVRISGIKVGSVISATLDPNTFLAKLTVSVQPNVKLPDDTVAEIISAGLLGDKYVSLVPGGSEKNIPAGGKIKFTQSSISLESLIGKAVFSAPDKKPGDSGAAPSGAAHAPSEAKPPPGGPAAPGGGTPSPASPAGK